MVDGLSFGQLMAMTNMRALVRAGGVALMSSRTVAGDEGPGHVLTFGTGVRSAVPFENVRIRARRPHSLAVAGWPAIVAANENRSTPGLLGSGLKAHGLLPGTYSNEASLVSADRKGVTVAGGEDSPVFVAGPDLFRSHTGIRNLVLGMRGRRLLVMVLGAAPSAGMN